MEELNKHYSINHQRTPRNLDEFKQMKQKHLMTTITTSNIHATYALRSRKKSGHSEEANVSKKGRAGARKRE